MKMLLIAGLALMLVSFGCVNSAQTSSTDGAMMEKEGDAMVKEDTAMEKEDTMMEKDDSMMEDKTGDAMMKKGVAYIPFTQEAYEQAKAEGKTIFLEFYANWCPICKAQAPALEEGFSMIESDTLVAFRVNYKDSETDASETTLAQQFNITYQHTHVVTSANEETLLKSQEEWTAQDVVEKVGAFG